MAITVDRAIELIVDWTHAEIVALEAHLGVHPNRKSNAAQLLGIQAVAAQEPAPTQEPPHAEEPQGHEVEAAIPEPQTGTVAGDDGFAGETGDHAQGPADGEAATDGHSGHEQPGPGDAEPQAGAVGV